MSSNNNHLRLTVQSAPPPTNDYQPQPKLIIANPSSAINHINQPKLTIQGPSLPFDSSENCDATTRRGRVTSKEFHLLLILHISLRPIAMTSLKVFESCLHRSPSLSY